MGISLVAVSGGQSLLQCPGLPLWWLLLLQRVGSGTWALVAVVPRLQSTDATAVAHGLNCSVAHGISPDQRSNQHLLYQQADSLSLSHQGSPGNAILFLILLLPHNSFVSDFILILLYGSFQVKIIVLNS